VTDDCLSVCLLSNFFQIVTLPTVFVDCSVLCSEFDQKVRESKLEADEALKKIPEIERMINSAEQMTREAQDSLTAAAIDANAAMELAELAKNIAENADRVSRAIFVTTTETKTKIITIRFTRTLTRIFKLKKNENKTK